MMEIVFSVTPAVLQGRVAILTYEMMERQPEDNRWINLMLAKVSFNSDSPWNFREAVLREVPVRINYRRGQIPQQMKLWTDSGCGIKDITEQDVGFERFWNVYGHKVGNKAGTEKKWGKLSWEDKILALGSIPRMKRYYESKKIELPYPETYINQRRWENVFE